MQKKNNRLVFNISLLLLLGVAAVFYWNILSTVIAGIIFAFILNPAVSYIESYGVGRTVSIIAIYFVIALSLVISMIFVVPKVVNQGESIFSYINKSEVVQKAMRKNPATASSEATDDKAVINIYLNYDKSQEKIVLNKEGMIVAPKKKETSPVILPPVEAILPEVSYTDSLSQESLKKFMEIPILSKITNYIEYIDNKITFIDITDEIKNASKNLKDQIIEVPKIVISNVSKIASTFAFVFMIPFISFFILKDKNLFSKMFNTFIPNRFFELYITITHKISELVSSFLRALLVEIIIVGVLTAIVLSFIGVNYAVLIGLLAGLANMVPYFGPFFGVVFAISSVILTGQDVSMIIYIIFGMWGVQVLDNNVVYPIVIGKSTNIHPLYVFLTVVAGGYLFGVLGMILSVPIVYIVSEISKELYASLKKYDII
jgi:predicted PurR-regulated permease PerM